MNVNMIKLPLIRVAHPSQEECEKEYSKITATLQQPQKLQTKDDGLIDIEESMVAAAKKPAYTPHLFNFEHPYDPELTPRRTW